MTFYDKTTGRRAVAFMNGNHNNETIIAGIQNHNSQGKKLFIVNEKNTIVCITTSKANIWLKANVIDFLQNSYVMSDEETREFLRELKKVVK